MCYNIVKFDFYQHTGFCFFRNFERSNPDYRFTLNYLHV